MAAGIGKKYGKIIDRQREYSSAGGMRGMKERRDLLKRLLRVLQHREVEILAALRRDLGKPPAEAYTSELLMVEKEIRLALKKLKRWMKPQRVRTPLIHKPGSSRIIPEPYGSVLIISPWNYPLQLLLAPLVSALAAGNTAVVKPSELAPATEAEVKKIIGAVFRPEQVAVVTGGVPETTALLKNRFDMIFYTGSSGVGRVVMRAAAEHLTPVVLELGGKSPCIVDRSADLEVTARRVAWGKFLNAGQTCVAPDYLYVEESIREPFLDILEETLRKFYGEDPASSTHYGRIINGRHFDRLAGMIPKKVRCGGLHDRKNLYIAPTLVDRVSWKSPLMREEIFGPILPVLSFTDIGKVIEEIRKRPSPLALYLFTKDRRQERRVLAEVSCGGVCINDAIRHIASEHLPFGGVGESGMDHYHGEAGFRAFSHRKSVMRRSFRLDNSLTYPPYRLSVRMLRRLSRFF